MIYQYAMVDSITLEVVGKYVSPLAPTKMAQLSYSTTDLETAKVLQEGTCFLSKAQKYWDVVKDPLYLVECEQRNKYTEIK